MSWSRTRPHHLSALRVVVCPYRVLTTQPTGLNTHNHAVCWATFLRPRLLQRYPWWCRNINLLSIAYASRPRLRYRLTRGRIILPQETLGLRRPGFSPGLSLLMPAYSLLKADSSPYGLPCISLRTLAYHSLSRIRGFGAGL